MAARDETTLFVPARGDPIRVVPVATVDELAAPVHGAPAGPTP